MTTENLEPSPLTWLGGDRRLARSLGRPVRDLLQIEASAGLLLILATIVALVWANSPWQDSYESFIHFTSASNLARCSRSTSRLRRGSTMP